MQTILNSKPVPSSSPQFVLALQSPLYQATHYSMSSNGNNALKPITRSGAKSVELLEGKGCGTSNTPTRPMRRAKSVELLEGKECGTRNAPTFPVRGAKSVELLEGKECGTRNAPSCPVRGTRVSIGNIGMDSALVNKVKASGPLRNGPMKRMRGAVLNKTNVHDPLRNGPVRGVRVRGVGVHKRNANDPLRNGPLRGMRRTLVKKAIANGVQSNWVNVLISLEASERAYLHNFPIEVKVPIEVKEVTPVSLEEPVRQAKQEILDEEPLKRARERGVEEDESSSLGHVRKLPRFESGTKSSLPEAHISGRLREGAERPQNFTETNRVDECTRGSGNERHVRFMECMSLILQESIGFLKGRTESLKRSTESRSFEPSYDDLKTVQSNAKRLLDEVDEGIHLRVKELQKIDVEKGKAQNDLVAERDTLLSKIENLKQENISVREKCIILEMKVDRLSRNMAEADKKREAEADKVRHANELAKEVDALGKEFIALREQGRCQMCSVNPRDGLILPCLHLLYCYQCLEKYKLENKECPWTSCKCRINAVLQCILTSERSPV